MKKKIKRVVFKFKFDSALLNLARTRARLVYERAEFVHKILGSFKVWYDSARLTFK